MARHVEPGDDTIAGYWMTHGYSRDEALQIERNQIADALAREELYDSMEQDVF
jgi:hypothetical protein